MRFYEAFASDGHEERVSAREIDSPNLPVRREVGFDGSGRPARQLSIDRCRSIMQGVGRTPRVRDFKVKRVSF